MGLKIIVHIMLEFYCLVFFGGSIALLREELSASAGFLKGVMR